MGRLRKDEVCQRAKSRLVRACQQVCVEAWQQKRRVLGHSLKQPPCLDHNHSLSSSTLCHFLVFFSLEATHIAMT